MFSYPVVACLTYSCLKNFFFNFFISFFSSGEKEILITSALVGCRIAPSFRDGLGCGFSLQF